MASCYKTDVADGAATIAYVYSLVLYSIVCRTLFVDML